MRLISHPATKVVHRPAKRRTSRRVASVTSAVSVLGLLCLPASGPASAASGPAATSSPCRYGVLTPTPSPGRYISLFGISALASNDVWAVGYSDRGVGTVVYRPLIEHWNGTAWSVVASPRPMTDVVLYAVAAISPADVWAVGRMSRTQVSAGYSVIEHWNGSAWSVVASPRVQGFASALTVASPGDVWAVGLRPASDPGLSADTLAEHWDGTRWRVVPTPNPGRYGDSLSGVTVAGPDDVWATGDTGTNRFDTAPLSEHWDGHAWSVVKIPAESFTSALRSLTSAGPSDVWAAGWYDVQTPTGTVTFTLAEHWNGHFWALNFPPSPTGDDTLNGITAVSANDMWAVGSTALNRTFVLHWNGLGWKELSPGLAQKGNTNVLWSVSAPTPAGIWASGGGYHTLVEHICPVSG